MEWNGTEFPTLWERLRETEKTVVLYGMGNGADKILSVCEEQGIDVCEIFASDAFVRGQLFHGKRVRRWDEVKALYGAKNLIVLLAFATSLPDVLENVGRIAAEAELYVPDVPVFGNGLFDASFVNTHRAELLAARNLLCDNESRMLFDAIVQYKLSGELPLLLEARSDPEKAMRELIRPEALHAVADLGAYNGDTVRELLAFGARPEEIYAMEPDRRNFRKLSEYAEGETRTRVIPVQAAAWSRTETLIFDGSGNRNASAGQNRSAVLSDRPMKTVELPARSLDSVLNGKTVDYIKYDVEGSECEALIGSCSTIEKSLPTLLVSLYHRNEDLFALPLQIHKEHPAYEGFYLRRFGGVPAWDLNLYVRKERIDG